MADAGGSTKRLAGLVLLGGLPIAGLGVWWSAATEHRVLVAVLAAGYLAVFAVGGFLRDVGSELRRRWTTRVADRTDRALRTRVSGIAQRYRRHLAATLQTVDLRGLAVVGFYTPELDEVYIDVSLRYQAPGKVAAGLLTDREGNIDRLQLNTLIGKPRPVILAVLGAPGSGKTTLLRHTARQMCRARRFRRGRRPLPVLLSLRDHIPAIVGDPRISLARLAGEHLRQYGIRDAEGWLDQQFGSGRCVVLLDGFDEVADQDHRLLLAQWVELQCARYPGNDFVITSRPQGYRSARIDGAVVAETRAFTDEQVDAFIRAWYRAIEGQAAGGDGRAAAKARATDLLDRLKRSPELYELTVNPLLLTMIANVHRESGALPGSRADLYAEICQVALGRRQEAKDLPSILEVGAKEALLRRQAFTMMRRHTRDVSRPDFLAALRRPGQRRTAAPTPEDLLADLIANGLIIEHEPGQFSFAHLTLQEYLAAEHVRAEGLETVLVNNVTDPWWRETTLLYAARTPAGKIVHACLDTSGDNALLLALDCLDQGVGLDSGLREQVDRHLDRVYTSTREPERRQHLAAALLTRELRARVRLGTSSVCRSPISERTYALFRGHSSGEPDDETQPVTGVWGRDAVRLVAWVNEVTSGGPSFRLPRRDEVEAPPVRAELEKAGIASLWLADGDSGDPVLWAAKQREEPFSITWSQVERQLARDVQGPESLAIRLMALWLAFAISKVDAAYARKILETDTLGDRKLPPVSRLDEALGLTGDHVCDLLFTGNGQSGASLVNSHAVAHRGKNSGAPIGYDEIVELATSIDGDLAAELGRPNDFVTMTTVPDPLRIRARFETAVGTLLSRTAEHVRREARKIAEGAPHFSSIFLEQLPRPADHHRYLVPPEVLHEKIEEVCAATLRHQIHHRWTTTVTGTLQAFGDTLANTRSELPPESFAATRIAAMSLTELDHPDIDLRQASWTIAAGLTALQTHQHKPQLTEAIVLAAGP